MNNTSTQIPVFSGSNPKTIAKGLSSFCKTHTKPSVPNDKYVITLKLWTSLEKGQRLDGVTGKVTTNLSVLNATIQLPDTTPVRNPGVLYREVTLDKISDESILSTILEEYQ